MVWKKKEKWKQKWFTKKKDKIRKKLLRNSIPLRSTSRSSHYSPLLLKIVMHRNLLCSSNHEPFLWSQPPCLLSHDPPRSITSKKASKVESFTKINILILNLDHHPLQDIILHKPTPSTIWSLYKFNKSKPPYD